MVFAPLSRIISFPYEMGCREVLSQEYSGARVRFASVALA